MKIQDTLVNIKQTAERLSLSVTKVRRLAYAGDLKAVKIGRRILFRESDIQAFIKKCPELKSRSFSAVKESGRQYAAAL